jgi:hypothetical protein
MEVTSGAGERPPGVGNADRKEMRMDGELRTSRARRVPAPPFRGSQREGAGLDPRGAERGVEGTVRPQDLVGAMFTTPKELRHLAEQAFGEEFVPTRVLAESPHFAVFALNAGELGQVVVHAERGRHWYPFRVTRVETGDGDGRPVVPPPYRPESRPRVDWL